MLEKPDLQDEKLFICLRGEFGIDAAGTFLPLGADQNTAVYRVVAHDGTLYFLKLRGGTFDEMSVTLPKFLSDRGVKQIIAPLLTQTRQLRTELDDFKAILYPFGEPLLSTTDSGEDRERSLHYLMSNFLPGGTIEMAYKSDTELENPSTGGLT